MTRAGFLAAALATALATSLGACSDETGQSGSTAGTPPAAGPEASNTARVRQILVGIKGSHLKTTRSDEQALALAKSLIADLVAGRRTFDELVDAFTDDRDPQGKPNAAAGLPPGTYLVYRVPPDPRRDFVKSFKDAAFSTPVGQVAPEPVKSQFGYHIIRREK